MARVLSIGGSQVFRQQVGVHLCFQKRYSWPSGLINILRGLGYENVRIVVGDGSQGLPEAAPFDAIVVSAAAPQVPGSLFEQLREGGRMVIPIGPAQAQQLQLVIKRAGSPVVTVLEGCRFVPLIGEEGYPGDW